jgi:hypothetical protein
VTATPALKPKGRPRKHSDNAAKQAAYRKRKQDPERRALIEKIARRLRIRNASEELAGLSIRKLKWIAKFNTPGHIS